MQIASINPNISARNSQPSFGAVVNVKSVRKLGPSVTEIISSSVKSLTDLHADEKGNVIFDLASKFCATINPKKITLSLGRRLMINCTRVIADGSEVASKVYVAKKDINKSGTEAIVAAAEKAYSKGTKGVEEILGKIKAQKHERLSQDLAATYNNFNA